MKHTNTKEQCVPLNLQRLTLKCQHRDHKNTPWLEKQAANNPWIIVTMVYSKNN